MQKNVWEGENRNEEGENLDREKFGDGQKSNNKKEKNFQEKRVKENGKNSPFPLPQFFFKFIWLSLRLGSAV